MLDDLLGPIDNVRRGPKKGSRQPENIIQTAIIEYLELRDWFIMNMTGNKYQAGVPDLYICHIRYGPRWVEVKREKKYSFTPAQLEVFPKLSIHGVGIWILTAATKMEYAKLFKAPNWHMFLPVMK